MLPAASQAPEPSPPAGGQTIAYRSVTPSPGRVRSGGTCAAGMYVASSLCAPPLPPPPSSAIPTMPPAVPASRPESPPASSRQRVLTRSIRSLLGRLLPTVRTSFRRVGNASVSQVQLFGGYPRAVDGDTA